MGLGAQCGMLCDVREGLQHWGYDVKQQDGVGLRACWWDEARGGGERRGKEGGGRGSAQTCRSCEMAAPAFCHILLARSSPFDCNSLASSIRKVPVASKCSRAAMAPDRALNSTELQDDCWLGDARACQRGHWVL
jgi:hypothetical protein